MTATDLYYKFYFGLLYESSTWMTAAFLTAMAGVVALLSYRQPREAKLLLWAIGFAFLSDFALDQIHQRGCEFLTDVLKLSPIESRDSATVWDFMILGKNTIRVFCRGLTAWLILKACQGQITPPGRGRE